MTRNALRVAGAVFLLMSFAHFMCFALRVPVAVGGWTVPPWASELACVAGLGLAFFMWAAAAEAGRNSP